MALKRFLYFGDDRELTGHLRGLLKKNTDEEFEFLQTSDIQELLKLLSTKKVHLLMIDYTHENSAPMDLGGHVRMIKRNPALAKIPVVAVTDEEKNFTELQELILQGHCYVYIKGSDLVNLALVCCLIAFETLEKDLPQYARARKLFFPLEAKSTAIITSIGPEFFTFDSDMIFGEGDSYNPKFNLYPEFNVPNFMISKVNGIYSQFNLLKNYLCPIPFKGPFDSVPEEKIDHDSYKTWYELSKENTPLELTRIYVFDERLDRLDDQYLLINRNTSSAWFFDSIGANLDLINEQRPDILVMNIGETQISFEDTQQILNHVLKEREYLPMLFFYNSPSTALALRQAFGYDLIMAIEKTFSYEHFKNFLDIFEKKKLAEKKIGPLLKPDYKTKEAQFSIKLKIELTTLTEHEFTFYYNGNLPLYTILFVKLPCPMLLLIVPPPVSLAASPKGTHYYALINAVSEEKLEFLRTFVNKAIHDSKQAFQDLINPPKPVQIAPPIEKDKEKNSETLAHDKILYNEKKKDEDEDAVFKVKRKSPYKGPSKL